MLFASHVLYLADYVLHRDTTTTTGVRSDLVRTRTATPTTIARLLPIAIGTVARTMPQEGAEVVAAVDGGKIAGSEVVDVGFAEAALGTAIEVDTDLCLLTRPFGY